MNNKSISKFYVIKLKMYQLHGNFSLTNVKRIGCTTFLWPVVFMLFYRHYNPPKGFKARMDASLPALNVEHNRSSDPHRSRPGPESRTSHMSSGHETKSSCDLQRNIHF